MSDKHKKDSNTQIGNRTGTTVGLRETQKRNNCYCVICSMKQIKKMPHQWQIQL